MVEKSKPSVEPYKAICMKFGTEQNDQTFAYNVFDDNIQAVRSNCPVDHLWIPKPVQSKKDIYYLISAKNGEALTQNSDDSLNLEKMRRTKNQRWRFINDGCNLYQIQNDSTNDYISLLDNDEVTITSEDGAKDVKSMTFVIAVSYTHLTLPTNREV